ncbi:PTS transporter subunit EIIC [Pectinatus haikarae]|uniref:PTS transporter subunit EIIC n=1 Tax=Pectinatus haikarae TaxID=349096 RepID=UPI0018C81AB6|nr:PTS transporter subunit EIIC [Pectinatus haikarae]
MNKQGGAFLEQIVQQIYELLFSYKIIKAYNCMTRLRILLGSTDGLPLEKIKAFDNVLGTAVNGSELQIILGPGKAEKAAVLMQKLLEKSAERSEAQNNDAFGEAEKVHAAVKAKNATPFKLLLRTIANIFLPLIPAFIACGLITGLLNIILKVDPALSAQPLLKVLQVAGTSVFWGMNIFVGVNAAREFGASPMLGGTMAVIITHPMLAGITVFGEELSPGRGGIIAVLLVVAFSSWLEKRLHGLIPQMFDLFLTPLLVILLSALPALLILQPIGGMAADAVGTAVTGAIDSGGMFTGFILGGIFLPLVITGLHQGLTPIHAQLLSQYGVTVLLPILAMAGAGQVGAACAVYVKTKNQRLKKTILAALPVGIMGVGEPLIYGVTMPLGRPFFTACIGGAFGGSVQAAYHVGASALGISGLPLFAATDNIAGYLAGLLTAYGVGFAATYLAGFDDPA